MSGRVCKGLEEVAALGLARAVPGTEWCTATWMSAPPTSGSQEPLSRPSQLREGWGSGAFWDL